MRARAQRAARGHARRAGRSSLAAWTLTSLPLFGLVIAGGANRPAETDGWELETPEPVPYGLTDFLERYAERDCASCHETVAREWATSRHALSWVNERYQEELVDMRRPKGCWGCHVPVAMHAGELGKRPKPRAEDRHFGITCSSCHLDPDGSTVLGPWGNETEAHASRQSPSFLPEGRDALCISCHKTTIGPVIGVAKDFKKTKQQEKGKSCVACHMAPVERPAANHPEGEQGEPYPAREGRSHLLQTPRDPSFLRRALKIETTTLGETTRVSFTNECGHRVPGLIGRSLKIQAEVLDAAGEVLGSAELKIDHKSFVPVDGIQELVIEARGPRLRLTGEHDAPGFEAPVPFLEQTLDLE